MGANDRFFVGKDDQGNFLTFDLDAGDASKEVLMSFSGPVNIAGGTVDYLDAPLGSYLRVAAKYIGNEIRLFVIDVPLLGKGLMTFEPPAGESALPYGVQLSVKVFNSNPGASFQVVGFLTIVRDT